MKKSKLILLIITIVFVYSCHKDKNFEVNEINSVKTIDMNNVGDNYDKLVLDILSDSNLDIVLGDFKLEIREIKPAIGLFVENTIILEDERNNQTIIIDHNTQSIYVRSTDMDEKYNYVLYGFKNSAHLDNMVNQENYNIDMLKNGEAYKKNLDKTSKLDFKSTRTSFIIKKPILTTEEAFLHSKIEQPKSACSIVTKKENYNSSPKISSRNSSKKTWNLIIYKKSYNTNTSTMIDAVKSTFKSLSSKDGSNFFYSKTMYANLSVSYKTVSRAILEEDKERSTFDDFYDYLSGNNVLANHSNTIHIYLKNYSSRFKDGKYGWGSNGHYGYRMAVSANLGSVFAHEVGHTLGAGHYDDVVWDSSLGWFGWHAESVMHRTPYGNSWYADVNWKYYGSQNRSTVKNTLKY